MSPLRTLFVLVVFVALVVVEVWSGSSRLSALGERRRTELVDTARREHGDVARRLQALVERARRQTDYVAGLGLARELLAGPAPADDAAAGELVGFLGAFPDVDALRFEDAAGVLRARVQAPGSAPVLPAGASSPGVPWLSAEVFADGVALGVVRARLALPAFERSLAASPALPGLVATIVPEADASAGDASAVLESLPPVDDARGLLLRSRLGGAPRLRVETLLPDAALARAMQPLSREYTWIVGSMVAFTAFALVMGGFVLRLGRRAFRLRETEHYLRWIRRVTDRYRALLEGAADMILIVDADDGRVCEANAEAREALGLPAEAAAVSGPGVAAAPADAARLGELLVGDGSARVTAALTELSERGGRSALSGLRLRAADGRVLDVDSRLARVDLGEEHLLQVSLRDVTQQREMERQLQTAERLSSLGLLTAGVAHEINNPLEGIGNYLALAERPDADAQQRGRYLGEVRRGLQRIRDIVQDLLSFARPTSASGRADLAQVVDAALGLSGYARDVRELRITRQGLEQPLLVPGDAGRLEQVVLNLVLNAARAVDGEGALEIRARRVADEQGAWVELELADDGPGIPADDLAHLFDPFFSRHSGTGLGLAVSFGIARAHGGTLAARNRAEGGAAFTLRLPADPQTSPAARVSTGESP